MTAEMDGPENGTKFRLFAQPSFLDAFSEPETVKISPPVGTVGSGPSDDRMYVVDPVGKLEPYGVKQDDDGSSLLYLPPWHGSIYPQVEPNELGHFDHLEPGTAEFQAAHLYGSARWVLDIWESYFGRRIEWHFRPDFERLELTMLPSLDNAYAGYGFLETGSHFTQAGEPRPFSLNFDVVAHEVGHLIIYSKVGVPTAETEEGEYYGFHESAADMVALISSLHFNSVVDDVLEATSGNLYTYNKLNRFAELSENQQIRLASNNSDLSKFSAGWSSEHLLSQPLTGALFDIFIDIFHENLVEGGLISTHVEELSDMIEKSPEYEDAIQPLFDAAYERDPGGFKQALLDARDYLGFALAATWNRLSPHYLNYDDVGRALIEIDRSLSGGRYRRMILNNFLWRNIGTVNVGPRIPKPDTDSHAFSARTVVPTAAPIRRRLPYFQRMTMARRRGRHLAGAGR